MSLSRMYSHALRVSSGIILFLAAVMPVPAMAASFISREAYDLKRSDIIQENLYLWSERATIGGRVFGDVIAGGGTVSVTGGISRDALIVGGSVSISGTVGDDVRVAGGQVVLGGRIGGDLVVAGGSVHVLSGAVIEGDLMAAAGEIILDGTVQGDVKVVGGRLILNGEAMQDVSATLKDELTVGASAVVGETLRYRAERKALIPAAARIGELDFEPYAGSRMFLTGSFAVAAGLIFSLKLLGWLGFSLLIVLLWRRRTAAFIHELVGSFSKSLGQGLVVFLVVPLVIVLLLISFIGTFVGFAAIAAYALVLLFSRALAGIVLGAWLGKVLGKHRDWRVTVPWTIAGVIALELTHLVPFAGWALSLILGLAILGVIVRNKIRELH